MRPIRIFAYLAGAAALAASFLVYMECVHQLGFPDGHITALGHARRRLAYVFLGVSVALAACFIYLGSVAARARVGRMLAAAFVLYLAFIIFLSLLDYYNSHRLDDGVGG